MRSDAAIASAGYERASTRPNCTAAASPCRRSSPRSCATARVPPASRFLAAERGPAGRAGLLGAALDLTESYRSGTRAAPARIRAASDSLETYSPTQDRDLEDVVF